MGEYTQTMAICSELQANTQSPPDRTGYSNPRGSKNMSLLELAKLQRKIYAKAMLEDTTIAQLRDCALAWKQLESQRLDTAGQPRPGQYRPELQQAKRAKTIASWEEPKQVKDAEVVVSKAANMPSSGAVEQKPDTTSVEPAKQ